MYLKIAEIMAGGIGSLILRKFIKRSEYSFFPDAFLAPTMLYTTLYLQDLAYFIDILGIGYYFSRFTEVIDKALNKKIKKQEKNTKHSLPLYKEEKNSQIEISKIDKAEIITLEGLLEELNHYQKINK